MKSRKTSSVAPWEYTSVSWYTGTADWGTVLLFPSHCTKLDNNELTIDALEASVSSTAR